MNRKLAIAMFAAGAIGAAAAHAEVTVGVTLGATGPGASLGIHYKNAFQLMPKTLGGQPVKYIILADVHAPAGAVAGELLRGTPPGDA